VSEPWYSPEIIVIRNSQSSQPKIFGPFNKFLRIRSPIKERESGMAMEFSVAISRHPDSSKISKRSRNAEF
jgi:hypothetical protein